MGNRKERIKSDSAANNMERKPKLEVEEIQKNKKRKTISDDTHVESQMETMVETQKNDKPKVVARMEQNEESWNGGEKKNTHVEIQKIDRCRERVQLERNETQVEIKKKKYQDAHVEGQKNSRRRERVQLEKNETQVEIKKKKNQADQVEVQNNSECEQVPDMGKKQDAQVEIKKSKKKKEIARFGNYRNYYGYRISQDVEEDPRFKVLKREWFADKDCLDIGCNSGLITISVAKKFHCRSILGVDIDSERIEDAYWLLRKTARKDSVDKMNSESSKSDIVDRTSDSEVVVTSRSNRSNMGNAIHSCKESDLFDVVSFEHRNFVNSQQRPSEKHYDTIICFSVTKWIHLNWGDDGLITLFAKIWRLLHPGGILLLEPQPWKSYVKNRRVSELTASNYAEIKLYPESFQDILLDKIGFRTVESLSCNLPGSQSGFDRPVLAFWK